MRRQAGVPAKGVTAIGHMAPDSRDHNMGYLIVQLLPYLMLVFAIGLIVGWSTIGR